MRNTLAVKPGSREIILAISAVEVSVLPKSESMWCTTCGRAGTSFTRRCSRFLAADGKCPNRPVIFGCGGVLWGTKEDTGIHTTF